MPYLADTLLPLIPTHSVPLSLRSYIQGETPISTWPAVLSMTVTYLAVVFGTREIMKDRAPLKLTTLFRAHNLLLSTASLALMLLLGEEVISNWMKLGPYGIICSQDAYTPRLEFYLLMNYYFKYYEFIDTVFLALKKKPLAFLHVYHHAATAVLAFVQLNAKATVVSDPSKKGNRTLIPVLSKCWVAALLNLGVHVIMCMSGNVFQLFIRLGKLVDYYYFATAGGAKIWCIQWKKHLTTLQIAQFVIILASAAFASEDLLSLIKSPPGCNLH
ncbi:hypothetical protein ID866_8316, partial [Astraeus odoratus]